MPAMPFSPCVSSALSTSPCPDQSVQMLEHIFGPVITTITQGGDPNTQQMAANILATMFYTFNTGLLAVAGIIVGYVSLMGVANTANDGEAFGKTWSTWWTPARIIYGGGMLLPTSSGYSVAQIVVFTIALWGIGLANSIYNAAFTMSVVSPSGLISGVNQPGAFFGMRDFAKNYLEASYCAHAANAIYNPAGGSSSGKAVDFENYTAHSSPDYTTNNGGYSNAVTKITDRGTGYVDAGQGACGIVTLSTYTAQVQNAQSSTNGGTTTSTDPMGLAMENLHQTVQGYKVQAAKALMQKLDAWVATWPKTANDPGWSSVDSSQFNTYVAEAENQVATELAQAAQNTTSTTNNALQDYVQAITVGGWATAGGWFQRVGQLRSQFSSTMADPVGTVTPPTVNAFPVGDAGTPELANSIAAVISAINQKADIHASAGCSGSGAAACNGVSAADLDLTGALPRSVKDMSASSIQASLDNKVSSWMNNQMALLVSMVTGANTHGVGGFDNSTPYCGTAGQLGGSLNRMKCVGDYLTVIHGTLIASDGVFKVSLTTLRVAAAALSTKVLGTGLDASTMGTAVWDLYIRWLAPMIGNVIEKTAHLAFLFGVFLPSLPYLLFMMVVAGWVLSVLMTALAMPLWMCLHMTPERSFIGAQDRGYLLLLSLFARPALAIIGLIAAFLVSDPIIDYIATGFFQMRAAIVSSTGTVGWFAQFETFFWWFEMFGVVLVPVLYMVFGLPQALPGHVLEWIGGGVRDLGETGAQDEIRGGRAKLTGLGRTLPGTGGLGGLLTSQGGDSPRPGGGGGGGQRLLGGGGIGEGRANGGGLGGGGGGRRQSTAMNVGPQGVTSPVNVGPDGYDPPSPVRTSRGGRKGTISEGVGTMAGSLLAGRGFRQAARDGASAIQNGVGPTVRNMRDGGASPPPAAPGPSAAGPAEGSVRPDPPPSSPGTRPPPGGTPA